MTRQARLDPLEHYRSKRDFAVTPEPAEGGKPNSKAMAYVIQKHWASRLHYDFRLEFEGTLKSWAVPKGPSLDPHTKRMAVQVEDHPLSYGGFEGTIPAKQYGAGKVIVWDRGTWHPVEDAAMGFKTGKLKFELNGEKLRGKWTLIRMKGDGEKQVPWLLIKEHDSEVRPADEYDVTEALPDSVMGEQLLKKPVRTPSSNGPYPGPSLEVEKTDSALPTAAFKAKLPATFEPQLATLVESAPTRGQWLYELKFDGYRLLARLDKGKVVCMTRNGNDWTDKMPGLADALAAMNLNGTWLDGEIVVPDSTGIPNFHLLQGAFEGRSRRVARGVDPASPNAAGIVYYVFDIPFYAGHDLRQAPLIERRALLQRLMKAVNSPQVRFSDAFDAPSKDLVSSACKLGFEGLIGKLADASYESGRSPAWIKLKCGKRQEFVVGGYTDPKGTRNGLGALLLGVHDKQGKLRYAGNVGSGFDEQTLASLSTQLQAISTANNPFDAGGKIAGRPHWVKPVLLAEISFSDWTDAGQIRHGVFRGLRTDKPPKAITREKAVKPSTIEADAVETNRPAARSTATEPSKVAVQAAAKKSAVSTAKADKTPGTTAAIAVPKSLRVTHPERVIDAASGVTKLELVQHYVAVAPLMMEHIRGRPVSLVRAPAGVGEELFFQKHAKTGEMAGVKLLDPALDPGHDSLLEISSPTGLLSAAQMNTVEFHTWNAVASNIGKPDRMTFDLDPGDGVAWPHMQEAAMLVKTMLETLELVPFLKTSGGKGLHVVVPLTRQSGWDEVKDFSHHIVNHLAKTLPQLFVAKSGPNNRVGKIYADYLRNGFGATTASAWTARARPGMGVSVPVSWNELERLTSGAHWTVRTVTERLEVGNTPWESYTKSTRKLSPAMKVLGYKK